MVDGRTSRRYGGLFLSALLALTVTLTGAIPRAEALVADLSNHLVAITTAFTGSDVLVFGALSETGGDVVVVVRGPLSDETVRHKSRVAGLWINTSEMRFRAVPGYYAVASSRPLDEVASADVLARHQIGIANIDLEPIGASRATPATIAEFRSALLRNRERSGLFSTETTRVTFLGDRLFRTVQNFPANVPPGAYEIQIFHIRDREVASAQSSVLVISKIGVEAELSWAAGKHAALYGLGSIAVAVLAGWSASLAFRKQ